MHLISALTGYFENCTISRVQLQDTWMGETDVIALHGSWVGGRYPGHTQRLILGPFVETVPVHHVGNPLPLLLLLLMVLVVLTHFGRGWCMVSSSFIYFHYFTQSVLVPLYTALLHQTHSGHWILIYYCTPFPLFHCNYATEKHGTNSQINREINHKGQIFTALDELKIGQAFLIPRPIE